MSTDEISIRRCTWLLNQRKFKHWREAEIARVIPLQGTNPDFLVETTTGIRFFLELKSFEKDTILDKMDPGITVFSLGHMSLQKRANRLVKDAAKQLLPYACTGLPMVIGLDNYRQKGIGLDRDTLGSLFGEPGVRITVDATNGRLIEEAWVREDDGSPLASSLNRHVSAVLAPIPIERFDTFESVDDFSVERGMKVRIIFNEDAVVPFPRDIFNAPEDEHLN